MINKGVFISHRRVCLFHTVQAVLNNSFLTPGQCEKLVNSHRPWMGGFKRPLTISDPVGTRGVSDTNYNGISKKLFFCRNIMRI